MPKTDNPSEVGVHLFQRAGLGQAPYRYLGTSENRFNNGDGTTKPGGTCQYCGTGILHEFHLRSKDGKEFKVGSDCIARAGDNGILAQYRKSPEYRKAQRDKRQTKAVAVFQELEALLPILKPALLAVPHSRGFQNRTTGEPLTAWDEAEWMFKNAGAAGRATLLKTLKQITK